MWRVQVNMYTIKDGESQQPKSPNGAGGHLGTSLIVPWEKCQRKISEVGWYDWEDNEMELVRVLYIWGTGCTSKFWGNI